MDLNELAEALREVDTSVVEVTSYSYTKEGNMVRKTITFNYTEDGDYQWSISSVPLTRE